MIARAIIFLHLLCASGAYADHAMPMHFDHLSLQDGLSQNNVQSIFQDSHDYMWFATESGLNRYDGYTIHSYNRERGNPNGFANDFVWVIAEDAQQDLWLATRGGGVVRWSRANDSFQSFRHQPANADSIASDDVRTLLLNGDGTIWVGTRDQGLDLFDPNTGEALHFRHDPKDPRSLSDNAVYALHSDSFGSLWIGTDRGVSVLHPGASSFVRYTNDPAAASSLSDDRVREIYEDQSGNIWIGTSGGGLNKFERASATFTKFQHDPENPATLSHDNVRVVFEDDAERLWVGTANGLNLLDRTSGTIDRHHGDSAGPNGLNDNYINSIYQDRGGLLWIGTRSAGVSRWNPRSWSLGHYLQSWLAETDVTSFASTDEGAVWIGTMGAGLARLDERDGTVARYRLNSQNLPSISDDRVMSLLLARDGMLWIGTMTGGLNRLDPDSGAVQVYRHDSQNPASLAADGVMAIFEDRKDRLWIGTYGGGLSVLDRRTNTFRHFSHVPEDPGSLSDDRASAIVEDVHGSIWVGTFGGGLNRFDEQNGTFTRFHNDPYDPQSLADDMIHSLHVDGRGALWVGTAGAGLDRVIEPDASNASFRFENFSQHDGLPGGVVYGVQSDTANRLWVSTNYGLARLNPDTGTIKSFHRGHGLQGEEFHYGAHHRSTDGKLYFGGANGFNAFLPDAIEPGTYAPNIVLSSIRKPNQPLDEVFAGQPLSQLTLDHRDVVIDFSFAALDYTEPSQNTYMHLLQGFDEDWVDSGTNRRVTYTNLDAGRYLLKVKAKNSDGVESTSEFKLPVEVSAAPWATRTAGLVYAIIGLALLSMLWRLEKRKFQREADYSRRLEKDVEMRTAQLEERNLELQVASRAKSDFLARMSHEIRTPMNGMMGMTQLLMGTGLDSKQYRFAQTIKRSAESLLEIINDILDFSKIEAGRLELENVEFSVNDLVDETVELFSADACDKGVELLCSTPPGKDLAVVGDAQRIKQVLVNLVGNALKFTQDGEIVVRCDFQEDGDDNLTLHFEVSDTGLGIRPENLKMIFKSFSQEDGSTARRFGGTGLGLAICKQLVEMMDGKIGVASQSGHGSRFWFSLTLPKASPAWLSRQVSFRLANLNVLVVDDNRTNAEIVFNYLVALGVSATVARNGRDGLMHIDAASRATPFDLVMIDLDVGDMSGLKLANAIRQGGLAQPAKIALMAPPSTSLVENDWREAGVDDCLAKPIRQSALYESVLMLTASTGNFKPTALRTENLGRLEPLYGRILLVEDNPVNQAVAVGLLEELGCNAVVAINGQDAIERFIAEKFDLVLMDCEMPVMDGFAATSALREQSADGADIPIIALTANAVDGDKERCLAAGMQDYLSKPISVEKLHSVLQKWLPEPDFTITDTIECPLDKSSLDSIRQLRGIGGDKMVRRVVKLYVSNSAMLVEQLRHAIERADAEAIRQGAHALKSSSLNVGANGIANMCQKIENLGRDGVLDNLSGLMTELDELYPLTVSALESAVQVAS